MARAGLGCALLLCACDKVYDLGGRMPDADEPDLPCLIGSPFPTGTPVQIGDLGYSVEGARFSADQKTAYLSLCAIDQPKSTCELYLASYDPVQKRFSQLFQLDSLDEAGAYDAYPTITADGNYFLWSSNRGGHLDVYVATATNGQFPASSIVKLAAADGLMSNEPYVLGDSKTVYFSAFDGSTQWELYRSRGDGPGFGDRVPLSTVNSPLADDAAPVVGDNELEIFFASKRDDPSGAYDIYTAIRTNKGDPFGVHAVPALSTPGPGVDWPLWMSPDLCTLYYINKVSDDANALATLYVTSRK